MSAADEDALGRTILIVAALNLTYFGVEFVAALRIGSVSLFADSIDFLEDASVNLLILLALGWTLAARARTGMVLAGIMLVPAVAFLWTLWQKFQSPIPPEAAAMSVIGLGALGVNLGCAWLLARHRRGQGSLTRAAFLSARNDAVANVAIIGACRDHRAASIGLARHHRRTWDRRDEPRCRARGLGSRAGRGEGRAGGTVIYPAVVAARTSGIRGDGRRPGPDQGAAHGPFPLP